MEIEVRLNDIEGRKNLQMYYRDPITEKRITRSAGTHIRRDAERKAARWEEELRAGKVEGDKRITWEDARERYENEHNKGMPSASTSNAALNHFERVMNPKKLASVTTSVISRFTAKLKEEGMKPTTIAGMLGHLRVATNWFARMELLAKAPTYVMPKQAKGRKLMRGRPITDAEFNRMIEVVPEVRKRDPERWQHYLRGMWLSGLRRGDSLKASWDADAPFSVDLSDLFPRWRIYNTAQKSGKDELLPMTPDFADFLLQTPVAERNGPVFNLNSLFDGKLLSGYRLTSIISDIGRAANIVTDEAEEKFATLHDLRRAFGTRWASKVSPADLQRLMRHSDIQTTMRFYVAQDATDISARIWGMLGSGDTSGDTSQNNTQRRATKP